MFLIIKPRTIGIENLLFIFKTLGVLLADFFSDKRFKDAEANDWRNKKRI